MKPTTSAALFSIVLLVALAGCGKKEETTKRWASGDLSGGDPARGKAALKSYGCLACHSVPGVGESDTRVGPPLVAMASRTFLAGGIENNPTNLLRWIQTPRDINPRTAMPTLNVSDADARDMASYLYTWQ